jgi:hypothetical protein
MNLGGTFDARQVAPNGGGGGLPDGWYKVVISNSEEAGNENGKGVKLTYTVIEGPLMGQTQNQNLNLWNNNPQARDIAQRELSALCHVTGVFNVSDTLQLHNIPLTIRVGADKTGQYQNVKQIRDANGNDPGKTGAVAQPAPVQQPAQAQPQMQQQPAPAYQPPAQPQTQYPVAAPAPMPAAAAGWPAGPPAAAAPANGAFQPAAPAGGGFTQGAIPGNPPWGAR